VQHNIKTILTALKISDLDSFESFFPQTRDRDDISVLRCKKSGVIILSQTNHINSSHYQNQTNYSYWQSINRSDSLDKTYVDDCRRAQQFRHLIKNENWLDIGTGNGGLLDLLKNESKVTQAVEPQANVRSELTKLGYTVYSDLSDAPNRYFKILTLFHVLEHLNNPISLLQEAKQKLVAGGTIVVEVPHAKDALIALYNCEAFKRSSFWSEHLLLHTKVSLSTFLRAAGFKNVTVTGFQRYPISNHLYWLSNSKPGGHQTWHFLDNEALNQAYAEMLDSNDYTDTLIAYGSA